MRKVTFRTPFLLAYDDGTVHFYAREACRELGVPATPANIEMVSREFEKACRAQYPTTPIANVERDGSLTEVPDTGRHN
jgi:hypothetical protein